jgi:peptidoglycan/LPS O-acetylase OafA/YrhL
LSVNRNFGLDLARAAAITGVFFSHGVTAMAPFGVGVLLFFLLSGFLIGRIYLRSQSSGKFPFWEFWVSRWFRTLPPYYIALGLIALLNLHFRSTPLHLYHLAFLQNYLGTEGFGPSWSLCVEEHFYLALPLMGFVVISVFGRRSLFWLLPLAALIPETLRAVLFFNGKFPTEWYFRTQFQAEGLILGVWLAYVIVDRPELWRKLRTPAIPLTILPIGSIAYSYLFMHKAVFFQVSANLIYAIGFAAWLRLLYDLRWNARGALSLLAKSTIHGLALASYSIYLVHTLIFIDVRIILESWSRGAIKSIVILIASMAVSVLFYFLVERPTIQLRDRYLKKTPEAVARASRRLRYERVGDG